MLDIDRVEITIARGVEVKRTPGSALDRERDTERRAAALGAQQERLNIGRQRREPGPDPRPGQEEAAPRETLQRAPFALQGGWRWQGLALNVDRFGQIPEPALCALARGQCNLGRLMHLVEVPDFLICRPRCRRCSRAPPSAAFSRCRSYHVLARHGTDKALAPRLYLDNRDSPAVALVCGGMRASGG